MEETGKENAKDLLEIEKNRILEALRQGFPVRKMTRDFGIPRSRILKIRDKLIEEGKITKQEIDDAWARYQKENPAAQGLDKSKVRKPKGNAKAIARHERSIENLESVFDLVKKGINQAEIARMLEISETGVRNHINTLLEQGRITEDEISKGGKKSNSIIDRTGEDYLNKIDQIVEGLQLGLRNDTIRKKYKISVSEFNLLLRDIKYKGIMTSEQIEEARAKKKENDLSFVAEHVKNHYSITQMRDIRPDFTANGITPLIKELIARGEITQEQVDANRKASGLMTRHKDNKMTPEEQQDYVVKKVKKGFSPQEIVRRR